MLFYKEPPMLNSSLGSLTSLEGLHISEAARCCSIRNAIDFKKQPYASALLPQPTSKHQRWDCLQSGSVFRGYQNTGLKKYEVKVKFASVEPAENQLTGYLSIFNLTQEYCELTTFFEAEIIGSGQHKFLTRKWDTNLEVDQLHWGKFPEFAPYLATFNDDSFVYQPQQTECVFMRWKERFLVPDYKLEFVTGASYAGFYYICFRPKNESIAGYYYHRNGEVFQELFLERSLQQTSCLWEFN